MQILIRAPVSFPGFLYLSAGGALARGRIFFQLTQELQLVREEVARSRLKVNSVKHCEVSDGSCGRRPGDPGPHLILGK